MSQAVMTKAHRLYTEGHVRIIRWTDDGTIIATVRSGTDRSVTYRVEVHAAGNWSCGCKHGQEHQDCTHYCSHIEAVAMKAGT